MKKEYLDILRNDIEGVTGSGKEVFTIEALEVYLSERDIKIRYNECSKQAEYSGRGLEDENPEMLSETLPTILCSELRSRFKRCSETTVRGYLNVLCSRNAYHPVLELLNKKEWDGRDRFGELFEILGIEDDTLSQLLVMKWSMQTVSLLYNNIREPFSADGVLTLVGAQGIGKTSFFRKLGLRSDLFKSGVTLNFKDKDTLIRALSAWIAELGEVESSLKNIEPLKAFATQEVDEIRKPYGHEATRSARRTSLCASCNTTTFLIDPTGNRRFWTVPVEHINLAALDRFNAVQFWRQVQNIVKTDGLQEFRLTKREQDLLAQRNGEHEKPLKGELEILDILNQTDGSCNGACYKIVYEEMTLSEFKELNSGALYGVNVYNIAAVLKKHGYEQVKRKVDGKSKRVYVLPRRKYNGYP